MLEEKRRKIGTLMVILDVCVLAQRCTTLMHHKMLPQTGRLHGYTTQGLLR